MNRMQRYSLRTTSASHTCAIWDMMCSTYLMKTDSLTSSHCPSTVFTTSVHRVSKHPSKHLKQTWLILLCRLCNQTPDSLWKMAHNFIIFPDTDGRVGGWGGGSDDPGHFRQWSSRPWNLSHRSLTWRWQCLGLWWTPYHRQIDMAMICTCRSCKQVFLHNAWKEKMFCSITPVIICAHIS